MLCRSPGRLPSPMRLGRSAPPALVMPPEVVNVKGMPLRIVTSDASCHPPRMALVTPPRFTSALPLPTGSSYAALNAHWRRMSVYEFPRFSAVFHGTTGLLPPVPLLISTRLSMVCAHVKADRKLSPLLKRFSTFHSSALYDEFPIGIWRVTFV